MDAQQFLAKFGHIANALGGVARLRELVLRLAVQGRLVRQNDLDEPSEDFLSRSIDQTRSLVGRRARATITAHVGGTNNLPSGWILVSLGRLANPQAGFAFKASLFNQNGIGLPIIRVRDVGFNAPATHYSGNYRDEFIVTRGDWLVAMDGDFRVAMWESDTALLNQRVTRLKFYSNEINKKYVCIALQFELRKLQGVKNYTTVDHLSGAQISESVIALPPQQEQSRIVAKVDELMALCDKLEAQQQARRKLQSNLRQSTLQAVTSATSPHELQTTWTRLADNFGRIFHSQEDVDDLRKAVLDLAVSGYLSILDELDEPASVLKGKILAAKERGITDGSSSRKKHVKPEELLETTLPTRWESITLDEAISTIDAGWSPACLPSARDSESKWGVLKTTAVQVLRFLPQEHKELPASLDPRPQYQIEVGDILITRAGPKNRVGICCVVDAAPPRLMISDKLIRFHIVDDLINPRFVALCLSAGEPGRIVERLKSGMADSQMNISQDKLRSITIPLPPIEEQQRILTTIEAFMKVVDVYSERLRKSHHLAEQVAAAAVSSLTGIAVEQEEEPMKAPQTELIAPLRLGVPPDIKAQAPLATILARHSGEMSAKDLWQRFGGEIDAFYAQLKTEVAHRWILEPAPAEMRERSADTVSI